MAATKPKKRNSKPKAKKDIKKSIKRAGKQTAAEPELTTLARRLRMTRLERSVISVPLTKPGGKSKDFGRVQDFLKHYGYLGDKLSRGVLDKATKRAISNYQKFYGLDVTGAFDRATRAHMSQPRCGLPDRLSTSTSALTIVRKDCARDKCEITYAFDEGPNSGGFGNFVAFNAVRRAIATWERHLLLTFREVSLNDAPDVRIGWRPSNDPDFADLAGPSIAHADFPGSCSVLDREIATDPVPVHFERSEDLIWGDGDEDEHDIESVALHEWGHVLGLLHSNNPDAVMRAFIEPGDVRRDPHYDDLANLSALYPGYRRHGDSGNDAGVVRSNAALRHRDDQVLTAVRTASDTLRLIAWRVEGARVRRTGDSQDQAGIIYEADMARGERIVTACRISDGRLKLISWDVDDDGETVTRAGDSGDQAGVATQIRIVAIAPARFVTACRAGDGELLLISWRLERSGSLTRQKDTHGAAGVVGGLSFPFLLSDSDLSLTILPRVDGKDRVATAVETANGTLKVIVWEVAGDGTITRLGDSGDQAERASSIASCLDENDRLITAVRDGNGDLLLATWEIGEDGSATQLQDSDRQAGETRGHDIMRRPGGVAVALSTGGGTLKLIGFEISGEGRITRRPNSSDLAGAASLIRLTDEALEGDPPIVTAVRTGANTLKLIAWSESTCS